MSFISFIITLVFQWSRYTNVSITRLIWLIIFDVLIISWLIPTLYGVVASIFGTLLSYIAVVSLLFGDPTTMDQMLFGFTTGVYILLFLFGLLVLELSIWVTKKTIIYHFNVFKFRNREKIAKKLNKLSVDEWFKKHKLLNTIKSLSFIGAIVIMSYTGFHLFTGDENVFDVYGNQPQLSVVDQEDLAQDIIDGVAWDIDADFGSMKVEIYAIAGDEIIITHSYIEESGYEISIDAELNKITISNEIDNNFFSFDIKDLFELFNASDKVIIEVPEQLLLGTINVKSLNGKVEIRNISTGEIDVVVSNGSINIDTLTVTSNISLHTSNGDVKVKNIIGKYDLDIVTSNGRITLNNLEMNNYNLYTSNGRIVVDNLNVALQDGVDFYAKTSNGAIVMNEVYIDEIEIKTSNGDIDFYNTDTDFLPSTYLKSTSNGDINTNVR